VLEDGVQPFLEERLARSPKRCDDAPKKMPAIADSAARIASHVGDGVR